MHGHEVTKSFMIQDTSCHEVTPILNEPTGLSKCIFRCSLPFNMHELSPTKLPGPQCNKTIYLIDV